MPFPCLVGDVRTQRFSKDLQALGPRGLDMGYRAHNIVKLIDIFANGRYGCHVEEDELETRVR